MFTEEFDNMSDETKQKVAKKIAKIHRWVEASGGWNEVMVMAHSYVVFSAFEEMGFDVVLKPRNQAAFDVIDAIDKGNQSDGTGIILTD